MNKIREKIVDTIYENNKGKFDRKDVENLVFLRPDTIRLRYHGFMLLKRLFDTYTFPIDPEHPKPALYARDLLHLHREMKFPYYISKTDIHLFSEQDAFIIKIYGNIRTWLDSFDK
jgi:hypothetical protein